MKTSISTHAVFLTLAVALGCSESASVEDADLTSSEAAALVAEETGQATPVVFNVERAPTVEFSVPDMMCEHSCVPTVRDTLAKLPGVKDVKVELESKTATVAVDKDAFDAEGAVAALVDLQFTETKLTTGESSEPAADSPQDDASAEAPPT